MKKYTLTQYQLKLFSPAALPSLTPQPSPIAYPFRAAWEGKDAQEALRIHAAVLRGEIAGDDRGTK